MTRPRLITSLAIGARLGLGMLSFPAAAETITMSVRAIPDTVIDVEFYSPTRGVRWPGVGQVYSIQDYEVHNYKLNCQAGEKVCYGAWIRGEASTGIHWGLGKDHAEHCDDCCYTCNGTTTRTITLEFGD